MDPMHRRVTRRSLVKVGAAVAATALAGASRPARGFAQASTPFTNEKVTIWVHQGTDAELAAMKSMIDAFNAKYAGQITASFETISNAGSNYQDKVTSAAVAKQLPDILDVDGPFVAAYAYGNIFRPIGGYFSEQEIADFVPAIVQQGTWNNQLWALGAFTGSTGVMVNKKLFAAANVAIPTKLDEAWDWNTFAGLAKQLTKGGVKGLDLHMDYGAGEWFTYGFTPLIWSNGGDILSPDLTKATGYMNGPAAIDAMTKVQQLFSDGSVDPSPDPKLFEKGKAAMQMIGPWVIDGFKQYPDLDWTIAPLPYLKQKVSPTGSWAWGITQQAKNPAAAAQVLRWLVDPKGGVVPIVNANQQAPSRLSAFPLVPLYQQPPYLVYAEQIQKTAKARPVTPGYPVLTAKFAEAVANTSLGGDVKQALDAAAAAVDDDFKRNNGYRPK